MELIISILKNKSLSIDHYRYAATVQQVNHYDTSDLLCKSNRPRRGRRRRKGVIDPSGNDYSKALKTLVKCFQNKNSDIPIVLNHCLPIIKLRIQQKLNFRKTINHLLACLKMIYHNPSNIEDLESMYYQFIFQLNSIDGEFSRTFQSSIIVELGKKSNEHIKMLILIYNTFPYDEGNHVKMLQVLTMKHPKYYKTYQMLSETIRI
ncbi:hypothetical protein CLIB1444_01S18052 [[Candida] jaroonii]|uniref:Uncharacterized protein n=1 Tax=[Candida] jaroonii TaxID=467808 RepID=A0ACA9Y1W7_9ASCO|nr:hypothetical protein CLIB1444_01S18052 [[Candida] jaroonii]